MWSLSAVQPAAGGESADRWTTAGRQEPQPQEPPQQPPPDRGGLGADELPVTFRPVRATVDSNLTVSSWPAGQAAGALDSLIGRLCSNVAPQLRQRYSYRGMHQG